MSERPKGKVLPDSGPGRRPDGPPNDRFRDLIDLQLLQSLLEDFVPVRAACVEIFEGRDRHPWPPELVIPESWREEYRQLAEQMDFAVTDVDEAAAAVREFIGEIDTAR